MIPLEYEINRIKNIFLEMIDLVRSQITLTREALLTADHDLAADVIRKETRVNAYELTIDRECEDFLALHNPVASDLRLTIAIIKMLGSLERIGDHAYSTANFVFNDRMSINTDLVEAIKLNELFTEIDLMFEHIIDSFEKNDVSIAKLVFNQDKVLNKINKNMPVIMAEYVEKTKDSIENIILVARTVGKLERTGDLLKNMAEELIFFFESEVIKHRKKDKKIKKKFSFPGFNKPE